jgi:hypothetical protein
LAQFILGISGTNSDIVANAFEGAGGNITINANGVFGFLISNTDTPRMDNRNNITASSRFGSSGTIEAPNIDPSQGVSSLPTNLVDGSGLIDRRCSFQGNANPSTFTVMGRGGLPTNPYDAPRWGEAIADFRDIGTVPNSPVSSTPQIPMLETLDFRNDQLSSPISSLMRAAQAWRLTPEATVELVAGARSYVSGNFLALANRCDSEFNASGRGNPAPTVNSILNTFLSIS